MFKIFLLAFLAVAAVSAQDNGGESAPEPYNYAYDAGSHGAAEQRGADGKVTGYYTLVDADGRQRRVDYVADEAGFRAKVQTNEVGTKSENSADVEVLASPPTAEQLVSTSETGSRYVSTQQVVAPKVQTTGVQTTGVQYVQQPYTGYSGYSSYYPGSYYGSQYGSQYGYGVAGSPSYSALYGTGSTGVYGTGSSGVYGTGSSGVYGTGSTGVYGGYQTVVPATTATYYKQTVQPASYSVGNVVTSRYASAPVRYQTVSVPSTSAYRTTSYQTVGVPASVGYQTVGVPASVAYQTVPASVSYQASSGPVTTSSYRYKSVGVSGPVYTSSVVPTSAGSTANLLGSSNYIVLKKRESEAKEKVQN